MADDQGEDRQGRLFLDGVPFGLRLGARSVSIPNRTHVSSLGSDWVGSLFSKTRRNHEFRGVFASFRRCGGGQPLRAGDRGVEK